MPDPIVNVASPAITIAVLEDDYGTAITGATWTDAGSLNPAGAAWSVSPVAFIANTASNIYRLVGYTFTTAGEWLLVATPNADAVMTVTFAITVTDPASDAVVVAQAVLAASVAGYGAGSVAGQLTRIGTLNVVTGPVDPMSADRTIIYGDEETLTWSNDTWSIAADATVQMSAYYAGATTLFDGMRVNATTVSVALTAEQTGDLVPGRNHYRYSVKANADVLVTGLVTVRQG